MSQMIPKIRKQKLRRTHNPNKQNSHPCHKQIINYTSRRWSHYSIPKEPRRYCIEVSHLGI